MKPALSPPRKLAYGMGQLGDAIVHFAFETFVFFYYTQVLGLSGTLAGVRAEARLVRVDDFAVNLPPSPHMAVIRNEDQPGMIGVVGRILGDAGVNIGDMSVGQSSAGSSLMVLAVDKEVPSAALRELIAADGIEGARAIGLPSD